MITLKMGEVPALPDKFKCPICGDKLTLEIEAWTENGESWEASSDGIHTLCVSEPDDIGGDEWDDWLNSHYQMPYVDWLPVETDIYFWLKKNYKFTE